MVLTTDHPVVAMVQEDHLVDMDHLAVMGKGLLEEVTALATVPLGVVMVDLVEILDTMMYSLNQLVETMGHLISRQYL